MNTAEIEKIIGYTFKDSSLLERAFTHSSYAHDNGIISNEQLEFLGDGLLGFIVAQRLYATDSSEGEMTVKRSKIVSREPLCAVMQRTNLAEHIRFGQSVDKQPKGVKVVSDAFEALLAAVFLDGGLPCAESVVDKLLGSEIESIISGGAAARNYKGDLQEYVQKYKLGEIVYGHTETSGSAHNPHFTVTVTVNGEVCGTGNGSKLKDAEQLAAAAALDRLCKD